MAFYASQQSINESLQDTYESYFTPRNRNSLRPLESLDTLALGLGLKGSKRLSDSALKFRIASRQATNPEEVFSGTPPRVSAPKYPKEIKEVKQTQAEAPSG